MFNPKDYITKISGKDYLEVRWRILWFKADHPDWTMRTELISGDDKQATFKCSIYNKEGTLICNGHGRDTFGVSGDMYFEKSETTAIGRALAHAGFGTQFAKELNEGSKLSDAPLENRDDQRRSTQVLSSNRVISQPNDELKNEQMGDSTKPSNVRSVHSEPQAVSSTPSMAKRDSSPSTGSFKAPAEVQERLEKKQSKHELSQTGHLKCSCGSEVKKITAKKDGKVYYTCPKRKQGAPDQWDHLFLDEAKYLAELSLHEGEDSNSLPNYAPLPSDLKFDQDEQVPF